jgi:glycosyltransferase involved in cell wall biosynthesis
LGVREPTQAWTEIPSFVKALAFCHDQIMVETRPRVSVIIPALNEADRIERAVDEALRVFSSLHIPIELMVVDDGSIDATAAISEGKARVVKHKTNLGKGAAVRSGALAATGDWVLFLDADLSTHPSAFAAFLPLMDSADVLFGSRRAPQASIATPQPFFRNRSGQVFNLLVRLLTGLPYRDTQCGFKAFRLEVCRPLFEQMETVGWAFDVELLMRAQHGCLRIREIPVEWHHAEGSRVRLSHAPKIVSELLHIRHLYK